MSKANMARLGVIMLALTTPATAFAFSGGERRCDLGPYIYAYAPTVGTAPTPVWWMTSGCHHPTTARQHLSSCSQQARSCPFETDHAAQGDRPWRCAQAKMHRLRPPLLGSHGGACGRQHRWYQVTVLTTQQDAALF